MKKYQEQFTKPRLFLSSKKTISIATALLIIATVVLITLFKESIGAYIKQIGELVLKTTTTFEFELLMPITVVLILFLTLFISYYLLRSAHQLTGNTLTLKRRFAKTFYYIGNVYVVILEVILYGLIFAIGFTFTLPGVREQGESAIEFLLMPAILGIIIMICLYVVLNLLLRWLFSREYGGFLTVEELKWNRDMIELVSTVLFIFAILGTIITVTIDGYKFTDSESTWLFIVAIFTITLYVLKLIKNFIITFVETK